MNALPPFPWILARRNERMSLSLIREILQLTEKPGVVSLAGGLPELNSFAVDAFAVACERVLRGHGVEHGRAALQYADSAGYAPLREWVAASLPWAVNPAQVLITTGSQQGLDLVSKVLLDAGSRVLVENPTHLGALQAFASMEPSIEGVASDAEGVAVDSLLEQLNRGPDHADDPQRRRLLTLNLDPVHPPSTAARFLYVLPNFQNPTGRSMSAARRLALAQVAHRVGLPLVEDNPYGELWFDAPAPAPLSAIHPEGCIYLGSFSKILAPGLRLGFVVAPDALYPKLLQAKQAADLHTPSLNQRLALEVIKDGYLERHLPSVRARYKRQCQTMLEALREQMSGLDVHWDAPAGGLFLWLRLPAGLSAVELLPQAVENGVAFVPGAAFYAQHADPRTLRLSFASASAEHIRSGIKALAQTVRQCLPPGAA
ncbi:PLP-dependent aminotransferase family protein [Hydrogenophaga sp.]|uniref:aminotransferase-like domain-containing protein n=1 Tax=Hydrogenophaga sp. TaxID=1904254 RepID=UPI0019B3CD8B|nr:PLP-dependent aminotransferase family protein [Hydrogenophaga sp.]MBD3892404.1 PLP-dependent aminotransferase family protein [Hydrogenophaga sp.]